jgi:hypothetical protein
MVLGQRTFRKQRHGSNAAAVTTRCTFRYPRTGQVDGEGRRRREACKEE